ncbi:MAG: tetratricopeptide repeat protein [Anaerolineae bacterium]
MAEETGGLVGREGASSAAEWVREAVEAAKRGDRFLALEYLEQALQEDPDHEAALLWKAGLTLDRQEAIWCLKRVLAKNPHNARARAGLAWFQQQEAEEAARAAPPQPPRREPEPIPEEEWEEAREVAEAWPEEEAPGVSEVRITIPAPPEPEQEEEVPALLPGPARGVEWLQRRLEGREPAVPARERAEAEEEGGVPPEEARRVFPSIVDELRAGMWTEEPAPEEVAGRAARRMGGAQWLILALLLTALCGLVGIVGFLVMRPTQTPPPPTAAVVEMEARALQPGGDAVRAPAVTEASSPDLNVLQIRYLTGGEGKPSRLLGEVVNASSGLLADPQVEVVLYNAAGEAVLRQPGLVARRLLGPGARSPFEVVLRETSAAWERYSVRVAAQPVGPEVLEFSPEVAVPVHEAQDLGGGRYQIKGEVVNQAAFPAERVEVVCTLYAGGEEAIVAMAVADVEPLTLDPGGRGTFVLEVQVPAEGMAVSGYRLFAQGLRAQGP